jgi:hypothetical protein
MSPVQTLKQAGTRQKEYIFMNLAHLHATGYIDARFLSNWSECTEEVNIPNYSSVRGESTLGQRCSIMSAKCTGSVYFIAEF